MKALGAAILLGVLTGCASSAVLDRATDSAGIDARRTQVAVALDTHGVAIGGYQVVVRWDPSVAIIAGIHAADGADFDGLPLSDPATYASGATRVIGYRKTVRKPHDASAIFTITFAGVDGGLSSPVEVVIERVYDAATPPRQITDCPVDLRPAKIDFSRRP